MVSSVLATKPDSEQQGPRPPLRDDRDGHCVPPWSTPWKTPASFCSVRRALLLRGRSRTRPSICARLGVRRRSRSCTCPPPRFPGMPLRGIRGRVCFSFPATVVALSSPGSPATPDALPPRTVRRLRRGASGVGLAARRGSTPPTAALPECAGESSVSPGSHDAGETRGRAPHAEHFRERV